jgi:hypothetical protein
VTGDFGVYTRRAFHTLPWRSYIETSVRSRWNDTHSAGDVVRIQPNYISFCSIEAVEDIYGYSTKCNKGEFYKVVLKPQGVPPSIATELYIIAHPFQSLKAETKYVTLI